MSRRHLLCMLVPLLLAGCVHWTGDQSNPHIATVPVTAQSPAAPPEDHSNAGDEREKEIAELRARIEKLEKQGEPTAKSVTGGTTPPISGDSQAGASGNGGPDVPAKPRLAAEWNNGLDVSSADSAFRVHVGGNAQFDAGWNAAGEALQTGPGGTGKFEDGAAFRRASLRIDGTMYRNIDWLVEYDFENNTDNDTGPGTQPIGTPGFTEVSMTISGVPLLGNLRAGLIGEPVGMASLTSSRRLNFMERAPGINSFFLTSPGVMLFNGSENERVTWAAGVFHETDNPFGFGSGDGNYATAGRLTWLPWYEDDGKELVHLGLGASHRNLIDSEVRLRGRPSVRTEPGTLEPPLADTGIIHAPTEEVLDAEWAAVYGSWTVQSEYYCMFLHNTVFPNEPPPIGIDRGTLFYQGAYVEVLYFLTGETRAYNRKDGTFDRVIPLRNCEFWNGGCHWGRLAGRSSLCIP